MMIVFGRRNEKKQHFLLLFFLFPFIFEASKVVKT